jgi:hypothetical protein
MVTISTVEKEKESAILAEVEANNLKINVVLEVVLRVIDYLNNQLLGLLFYPSFFIEFYCRKRSAPSLNYSSNLKRED